MAEENLEARIRVIEAELQHLATKDWVLRGVVAGMVVAVSLTLGVIRLFSTEEPSVKIIRENAKMAPPPNSDLAESHDELKDLLKSGSSPSQEQEE